MTQRRLASNAGCDGGCAASVSTTGNAIAPDTQAFDRWLIDRRRERTQPNDTEP
jgi:hypothetical protein